MTVLVGVSFVVVAALGVVEVVLAALTSLLSFLHCQKIKLKIKLKINIRIKNKVDI